MKHKFKVGDFIRDEHFGWICGTVKQVGFIGTSRNRIKSYIIDSPISGEEILLDSSSVLVHSKELQETA